MSFNIPSTVEQDIERYAAEERLSLDAAVLQLIETGLQQKRPDRRTPIEEGLGLLRNDASLVDEAMQLVYSERQRPTRRSSDL